MRLEAEVRRLNLLEQQYTHGIWRIVKIYVNGKLREIAVNRREEHVSV